MKIHGDYLNRFQTIEDLSKIVKSCLDAEKPIAFSIEGEWGKGKTWVVDKLSDYLKGIDLSQEKSKKTHGSTSNCLVFTYNAWEKDYYEEPLLAIIITLINQLNKEILLENVLKSELAMLFELCKTALEESLKSISKRVIGIDIVDVGKRGFQIAKKVKDSSHIKTEADYAENNIEKDINTVVSIMNRLSKVIPIVFIVDELDRCLPEHAIKTLERLHHIMGKVNSSVTIISINESQLKETVQMMFGSSVPYESYMKKFVDFRVSLDTGSANTDEIQNKLKAFFELFADSLDDQHCYEIVSSICDTVPPRNFEKICNNTALCHSFAGKDTKSFSKVYAVAELLLFACKLAIEMEKNRASILPIYGNTATTRLGIYLKSFFSQSKRMPVEKISSTPEIIRYVCMKALLTEEEFQREYNDTIRTQMASIDDYFNEYIRYYKLIK